VAARTYTGSMPTFRAAVAHSEIELLPAALSGAMSATRALRPEGTMPSFSRADFTMPMWSIANLGWGGTRHPWNENT
jgi:hypothetical protein